MTNRALFENSAGDDGDLNLMGEATLEVVARPNVEPTVIEENEPDPFAERPNHQHDHVSKKRWRKRRQRRRKH